MDLAMNQRGGALYLLVEKISSSVFRITFGFVVIALVPTTIFQIHKIMARKLQNEQNETGEMTGSIAMNAMQSLQKSIKNSTGTRNLGARRPNNDPNENTTFVGLLNDLRKMRFRDVETLLTMFVSKQKGVQDDKQLLLENMIRLLSKLEPTEKISRQLTGGFVDTLWDQRQHPNLRTIDSKYQYRTADGSFNNILAPDLGKAGSVYTRSAKSTIFQNIALPDPGEIFDSLMARDSEFEPHPNGISSMLFNFATLITHDLFKTNHLDFSKSDTSSYLDLSPLYGNNEEEQASVRLFENGLLKPDCFSEKRILEFPPAVGVLVIMFNRFHNHVATNLALINENGRFTKPIDATDIESWVKYDNNLFQTARLITCGLYINCVLKDYVRTILSLNRTDSKWDLDPRFSDSKAHLNTPEGVGNQVAAEFNLVYRWHSAISKTDAEWTEKRFQQLFEGKRPEDVTMSELFTALGKLKLQIPNDPLKRPFAGLKRDDTTFKFDDDELVKILTDSIADVAGSFGANKVPKAMRGIEILGIIQSRKWEVSTLNEFRAYVGLTKHESFEDINPDPEVARKLRNLYQHPDFVELYPGLVSEKPKPAMSPGSGLCVNFTTSYAILSDAVSLVRGDRFYTLDYTPKALTNWGYNKANFDRNVDNGCVFYKLILNAFPNHFGSKSIYAHYPLVIPTENFIIMKSLGKAHKYTWKLPIRSDKLSIIHSNIACKQIIDDNENFHDSWGLAKDSPSTAKIQQQDVAETPALLHQQRKLDLVLSKSPDWTKQLADFYTSNTKACLTEFRYKIGSDSKSFGVDIVRDVTNAVLSLASTQILNLPSQLQAKGPRRISDVEIFEACLSIYHVRSSKGASFNTTQLRETTLPIIQKLGELVQAQFKNTLKGNLVSKLFRKQQVASPIADFGTQMVQELSRRNISLEAAVTKHLIPLAATLIAVYSRTLVEAVEYYLDDGKQYLPEIYSLTKIQTDEADQKIMRFFLEGARLHSTLFLQRKFKPATKDAIITVQDASSHFTMKAKQRVILDIAATFQDPATFPDPTIVKLDRPIESYLPLTDALNPYISAEASIASMTAMFKMICGLKNLRRASGCGEGGKWYGESQGELKKVVGKNGLTMYMTADQSAYSLVPTTMKVQWDVED